MLRPKPVPEPLTDEPWLTIQEVAEWFCVSTQTVHRWINSGKLIAFKCENVVRIRERAVLDFVIEYSTV
jgi:excisionase family DNA binding protein